MDDKSFFLPEGCEVIEANKDFIKIKGNPWPSYRNPATFPLVLSIVSFMLSLISIGLRVIGE